MDSLNKVIFAYISLNNEDKNCIFFEDETNTSMIYKGQNKIYKRNCCLKVISKEQLKLGDYDLLLEQVNREEKLTKLCNSKNTVNFYQRLETNENIIFELEYCDEVLKDYFNENETT